MVTIIQERGDAPLAPGERIKVLTPSGATGRSRISILRGATGGGVRVVRETQFAGEFTEPRGHFAGAGP